LDFYDLTPDDLERLSEAGQQVRLGRVEVDLLKFKINI
jgi:hypothetical protein